jgi:hypothetical protein
MPQENTNEPLSKTAVMRSLSDDELLSNALRNGGSSFYSNWCYDEGKIYGGHTTVQNNIEISDRQKVECN